MISFLFTFILIRLAAFTGDMARWFIDHCVIDHSDLSAAGPLRGIDDMQREQPEHLAVRPFSHRTFQLPVVVHQKAVPVGGRLFRRARSGTAFKLFYPAFCRFCPLFFSLPLPLSSVFFPLTPLLPPSSSLSLSLPAMPTLSDQWDSDGAYSHHSRSRYEDDDVKQQQQHHHHHHHQQSYQHHRIPPVNYAYTIMAAGQRAGKTSLLRLLLDTSQIAQSATKDQLASVARFVQSSAGPTSHIRSASIDVQLEHDRRQSGSTSSSLSSTASAGWSNPIELTVVDTPSLDMQDEATYERRVQDIIRFVETRFAESLEDDRKAQTGNHHVHLCLYFLDPDQIVPASARDSGPIPPLPRSRHAGDLPSLDLPPPAGVDGHGRSHTGLLLPPLSTSRSAVACLPELQVRTIRRLSRFVNVLPVIGRADTLTNDRLAAVRAAVRKDLADAGIGFGIFDDEYLAAPALPPSAVALTNGGAGNANSHHGRTPPPPLPALTSSSAASSPNGTATANGHGSPAGAGGARLPYALVAPDCYSHSDGTTRPLPSRHELVLQYTPATHYAPPRLVRGKYLRAYRWGALDVLDPMHSDFVPLRHAVFAHMDTLRDYTRDYLFVKFSDTYYAPPASSLAPPSHHASAQSTFVPQTSSHQRVTGSSSLHAPLAPPVSSSSSVALPPLGNGSAPEKELRHLHIPSSHGPGAIVGSIHQEQHSLAQQPLNRKHIDGSPLSPPLVVGHGNKRGPEAASPAGQAPLEEVVSVSVNTSARLPPSSLGGAASKSSSSRQRTKKITVACNFCRSRKLKCDGKERCSQCERRNHTCDYARDRRRTAYRKSGTAAASGHPEGGSGPGVSGGGVGGEESESDGPMISGDEEQPHHQSAYEDDHRSVRNHHHQQQHDQHSLSPEVGTGLRSRSRPSTTQSRNETLTTRGIILEPLDNPSPFAQQPRPASRQTQSSSTPSLPSAEEHEGAEHGRSESMFRDNELPHIATLSMPPTPDGSGNGERGMSVALPPMRTAPETGAGGNAKKRGQTTTAASLASNNVNSAIGHSETPAPAPPRPPRAPNHAGPKVVACNFCRTRKTKCDGGQPACTSCARRQMPCSYAHDPSKRRRTAATTARGKAAASADQGQPGQKEQPSAAGTTTPPPALPSIASVTGVAPTVPTLHSEMDVDVKRRLDEVDDEDEMAMTIVPAQKQKRVRLDASTDNKPAIVAQVA